jgi:MOSC domain-containing protein YiiM
MNLISVNIGQERTQQRKNYIETTGIYKLPVQAPVEIKSLGIEQDAICDRKNHGGPDQAIYVYGAADYEWWSGQLGNEISPGTFGENLTVSEMESSKFNIGDYLQIDDVRLQVSVPRIPCGTFAARMDDRQWVKRFRYADRPGLYCRVIEEGFVKAGDSVSIEKYSGKTISVLEMFRDYYDKNRSEETVQRQLKSPIAIHARRDLEEELQKF